MNVPFIPPMTGDSKSDIDRIVDYLYDLSRYLAVGEPDPAWSVTGTTTDKVLASGDTLSATQNVLGTLIQTLQSKGII